MTIFISGWTIPLINEHAGGKGCVNLQQNFVWPQIQFRPAGELKRSEAAPTSFFFLAIFPVLEPLRLSSRAIWSRRSSPRRILSSWITTHRHTKEFMLYHTHYGVHAVCWITAWTCHPASNDNTALLLWFTMIQHQHAVTEACKKWHNYTLKPRLRIVLANQETHPTLCFLNGSISKGRENRKEARNVKYVSGKQPMIGCKLVPLLIWCQ